MGKNKGQPTVQLYRWDQYNKRWVPFTGSTDEDGLVKTIDASLIPSRYDYISLGYTGDNLTSVVFKSGGSGGSTVATLTLAYTGSVLDSVTKS